MNNDIKVMFKKVHKKAKIPEYKHVGDSGCDLFAIKRFTVRPGEIYLIDLGFSIEMSKGIEAQIRSRSGLAIKKGLVVVNQPGTIDASYKGPVKVGLINLGDKMITIECGARVAQMVFAPVYRAHFVEVKELSKSDRGTGGFGSTGK